MVLASGRADLREGPRRIREGGPARFDEDGRLLLLGVAVLVAILSLAALTAVTVHRRDAALQAATAAAHRLGRGGQDGALYQDLVRAQQDQVALFQQRVYAPVQGGPEATAAAARTDPPVDLDQAQASLTTISGPLGASPQIQGDARLISWELSRYMSLVSRAQLDSQKGLPVGAAYLREASGYLSDPILIQAADIRYADQAQVTAANALGAAVPWPLFVADALVLVGLAGAQIVTARYTRRRLNSGLVLATFALIILVTWSTTALALSLHTAARDAVPHAQVAVDLAAAQFSGIQDHTDDLLSLADQGEDCYNPPDSTAVSCTFETAVANSLTRGRGPVGEALPKALKAAPDAAARTGIIAATKAARAWLKAESALPTLQNLAADAPAGGSEEYPRYGQFAQTLQPYMKLDLRPSGHAVNQDSRQFQKAVHVVVGHEWRIYAMRAGVARSGLGSLVAGSALLGLLAGTGAAAGIGWRVSEYWSTGRSSG